MAVVWQECATRVRSRCVSGFREDDEQFRGNKGGMSTREKGEEPNGSNHRLGLGRGE